MSLFHFGEYFATALTNPSNLSVDSFLLNHGLEYTLAAVASWTEFFLELWLFPKLKNILPMTLGE
jgi:protein-S-isoprenylcysteine O-methyltransferase